MKAIDIIEAANIRSDDNIENREVMGFLNTAISKANMELSTMLPIITSNNVDDEYYIMKEVKYVDINNKTSEEELRASQLESINSMFIYQVLIPYTSYMIKIQDGSQYEWEKAEKDFTKSVRVFNAQYRKLIDDKWLSESFDLAGDGKKIGMRMDVIPMGDDSPQAPNNSWNDNSDGSGNISGRADSRNPFGF